MGDLGVKYLIVNWKLSLSQFKAKSSKAKHRVDTYGAPVFALNYMRLKAETHIEGEG
jgi:hypothetical protein